MLMELLKQKQYFEQDSDVNQTIDNTSKSRSSLTSAAFNKSTVDLIQQIYRQMDKINE